MGNQGAERLKVGFICPKTSICITSCKCSSFLCGLLTVNHRKSLLEHSSFLLCQTSKISTSWLVVVWSLTFHWLSRHSVSQGSGAESVTWILKSGEMNPPSSMSHGSFVLVSGNEPSFPENLTTISFSEDLWLLYQYSEGEPDAGDPEGFHKI